MISTIFHVPLYISICSIIIIFYACIEQVWIDPIYFVEIQKYKFYPN